MNRDRLIASIKLHEGYSQDPYRDHLGYWTVATGHLIDDTLIPDDRETIGSLLDWVSDPVQHEEWLEADVDEALESAQKWLGFIWNSLTELRKEIVTEMAFQLGYPNLSKFVKFRAFMMDGDWDSAADEMLDSLWARQVPKRAQEMAQRFKDGKAV